MRPRVFGPFLFRGGSEPCLHEGVELAHWVLRQLPPPHPTPLVLSCPPVVLLVAMSTQPTSRPPSLAHLQQVSTRAAKRASELEEQLKEATQSLTAAEKRLQVCASTAATRSEDFLSFRDVDVAVRDI